MRVSKRRKNLSLLIGVVVAAGRMYTIGLAAIHLTHSHSSQRKRDGGDLLIESVSLLRDGEQKFRSTDNSQSGETRITCTLCLCPLLVPFHMNKEQQRGERESFLLLE